MSYREIERQVNFSYETNRLQDRVRENSSKMDPGTKECADQVGGAITAGIIGGSLTGIILGAVLVSAGVAVATAVTVSGVGAVVVGLVIVGTLIYCMCKK